MTQDASFDSTRCAGHRVKSTFLSAQCPEHLDLLQLSQEA
jgi:hypothetical protein